jgi:hypothetical protein
VLAILQAWKDDDPALRESASAAAKRLLTEEKDAIAEIIERDLGLFAWATFSLDHPSEGEVLRDELEGASCVYRLFRDAAAHAVDGEVRARAQQLLADVPRAGD